MPDTPTIPRTQDEIAERFRAVMESDLLGFKADILASSLDFEHAKEFTKEGVTVDEWDTPVLDLAEVQERAFSYLDFAFGKAEDHRGISANRSVDKLTEYAWLLGRDDIVVAMGDAGYENYGVPKLYAFAKGFEREIPDSQHLLNMSMGLPCHDGCLDGCG